MIVFVSGHIDITHEEFEEHYIPLIQKHIDNGDTFVIGDCKGCDVMAQNYISQNADHKDAPRAFVYHMFERPRNNPSGFLTRGGFKSDKERDTAMTNDSDVDIAWFRKGREKSGTAKNIYRRRTSENTRSTK